MKEQKQKDAVVIFILLLILLLNLIRLAFSLNSIVYSVCVIWLDGLSGRPQ